MNYRASFTVVLNSGVRLDAIMLVPTNEDGTGRPGLSFICSGRQVWKPLEEIVTVDFSATRWAYFCGMCERPLGTPGGCGCSG